MTYPKHDAERSLRLYGIRFRRIAVPQRGDPIIRRVFEEINRQEMPISWVAERAGIGKWTMNSWRRGDQSPTLQNVRAVCDVLGIKLTVD